MENQMGPKVQIYIHFDIRCLENVLYLNLLHSWNNASSVFACQQV